MTRGRGPTYPPRLPTCFMLRSFLEPGGIPWRFKPPISRNSYPPDSFSQQSHSLSQRCVSSSHQNWVVLENNNGHLTRLAAERLPLRRSLLESLQEKVFVFCHW